MMQLALDFDAPLAKPAKVCDTRLPPLLRSDIMSVGIPVMWAHARMKAGLGRGDMSAAERNADDIQDAMDGFEAILPQRDVDPGIMEEYAEWSAPIRSAVAVIRARVAEWRTTQPPEVRFKGTAFDKSRWTSRHYARDLARQQLNHRTGNPAQIAKAAVHHWRLLLEDAADIDACYRRIAWHEAEVLEAGGVLEFAIQIDVGLPMVIAQPLDRRTRKDHADAVRYAARKAL